ncbi:hypothetical protein [Paraburkholderia pallida]|uniref:Uncharacterized protein n=1 Tax=Paraburkholderia pallida TaxID=2547399 RepID=A0A4P7D4U4_9BURK|nr:hypothetical protein [Paraburkholderia pallida]QBR01584.1 hypothetical protein E1956_30915 [Paraburkholderia pallida]
MAVTNAIRDDAQNSIKPFPYRPPFMTALGNHASDRFMKRADSEQFWRRFTNRSLVYETPHAARDWTCSATTVPVD